MNGSAGDGRRSRQRRGRLDEFRRCRASKREAHAIDRRDVGSALDDRGQARGVRAGDDDLGEERLAFAPAAPRGAEQVHAGIAVARR